MKRMKLCGEKVGIPESWFELTTGKWVALMNITSEAAELGLLAAFTGLSADTLSKAKNINIDRKVFAHVGWYATPIDFKDLKVGKTITIEGKAVVIPKDLGFKTLGQKITLQQKMKDADGNLSTLIPFAFAVYMAPELYGDDYDLSKLDTFIDEVVNDIPIVDVFPIASFFLKKLVDYMNWRILSYTEQLQGIKSMQE